MKPQNGRIVHAIFTLFYRHLLLCVHVSHVFIARVIASVDHSLNTYTKQSIGRARRVGLSTFLHAMLGER